MISKLSKEVLNKCIIELQKDENKKNINIHIIDPLIKNITNRLYPYLITIFIMYILILILAITILIFLIMKKK